jgi:hypothetical protein
VRLKKSSGRAPDLTQTFEASSARLVAWQYINHHTACLDILNPVLEGKFSACYIDHIFDIL